MANLSNMDKRRLEKLLRMSGGYVLEFSNRTFGEFVLDSTGYDVYDRKYAYDSGSKANRLRAFWKVEPNHVIGRLLTELLECRKDEGIDSSERALFEDCRRIAERLQQGAPVQEIDTISVGSGGRDFDLLAKQIRESLDRNEPEAGIDRLHTFVVKFIRVICKKHGIATPREKPLPSLVGEYIKRLKKRGLLESEMTERILKSSISIFEAFDRVRNDRSLAHDNPILGYDESLLIFNHIASSIKFIESVERRDDGTKNASEQIDGDSDDLPF